MLDCFGLSEFESVVSFEKLKRQLKWRLFSGLGFLFSVVGSIIVRHDVVASIEPIIHNVSN